MMKDFLLSILLATFAGGNVMSGVYALTGNLRAGAFGVAVFLFYLAIVEISIR